MNKFVALLILPWEFFPQIMPSKAENYMMKTVSVQIIPTRKHMIILNFIKNILRWIVFSFLLRTGTQLVTGLWGFKKYVGHSNMNQNIHNQDPGRCINFTTDARLINCNPPPFPSPRYLIAASHFIHTTNSLSHQVALHTGFSPLRQLFCPAAHIDTLCSLVICFWRTIRSWRWQSVVKLWELRAPAFNP